MNNHTPTDAEIQAWEDCLYQEQVEQYESQSPQVQSDLYWINKTGVKA